MSEFDEQLPDEKYSGLDKALSKLEEKYKVKIEFSPEEPKERFKSTSTKKLPKDLEQIDKTSEEKSFIVLDALGQEKDSCAQCDKLHSALSKAEETLSKEQAEPSQTIFEYLYCEEPKDRLEIAQSELDRIESKAQSHLEDSHEWSFDEEEESKPKEKKKERTFEDEATA